MIHHLLSLTGKLFGKGKLSILQYHQVLSQPDPLMRGLITADNFEWHMKLISRYFTPLSLSSAIDLLQKNSLPANAICVTFDDGYQNNLSVALPILEKYNIPATIFIATGFSEGNTMWNDKVYHLFRDASRASLLLNGQDVELGDYDQRRQLLKELIDQLKYLPIETRNSELKKIYDENQIEPQKDLMLSPEEIAALAAKGIEIGAHTVNHPILAVLDEDQQFEEIAQCKRQLESWAGKPVLHFAYPNGIPNQDFTETTVNIVRNLGFKSAVATRKGVSTRESCIFKLHRFTPWDKTPLRFHLRLVQNQAY